VQQNDAAVIWITAWDVCRGAPGESVPSQHAWQGPLQVTQVWLEPVAMREIPVE
jgi:hypothetical protein